MKNNNQISHNCLFCNKPIKRIDCLPKDEEWQGMWDGGIVEKIDAGFGSELDGDMYLVAICDDCIRQKHKENKLIYLGNYLNF